MQYTVEIGYRGVRGKKGIAYKVVKGVKSAAEAKRKALKGMSSKVKVYHVDVFRSGNY